MPSYKYSVYSSAKRNAGGRRSGGNGGGGRSGGKRRGDYIDPSRLIRVATPSQAVDYAPNHKFADFAIDEVLKNNLAVL